MRITLGILGLALAAFAGPSSAFELSPAAVKALKSGVAWVEVSPDPAGASGRIRGAIDISASPEQVWRVMNDCTLALKMIANLERCRILKTDPAGKWDVREHNMRATPFVPAMRNVFRNEYVPFREIRFGRIEGDVRIMEGFWRFESMNGGKATRVTYENRVAAKVLAPAQVVRLAFRTDTPKVLEKLKRFSES